MRMLSLLLAGHALAFGTRLTAQEASIDWPQFRGPGGRAISRSEGLPLTWSENENVVWKTALPGPGASSQIVIGDRIFVTCYRGYGVGGSGRGQMSQLKFMYCLGRE